MGKTHTKAESGHLVYEVIKGVVTESHQDLNAVGAVIAVLFIESSTGPAISSGGYAVRAKVKLPSAKDRAMMDGRERYDVLISIDYRVWDDASEAERKALIDHELSHVRAVRDRGEFQIHDDGRPKLKLVPGDWNVGDGFAGVVRRHGIAAPEFQNLLTVMCAVDEQGNLLFPFAADLDPEFTPARQLIVDAAEVHQAIEVPVKAERSHRIRTVVGA